ncbi:hypothetical protein THAOC_23977 [Thalassiosira oceanica]|uniref:Uncharacterized protein n=1 Tax=Thalassiosira oceanica TaxID=159749 RepID=K0SBZ8_THAOC|nr:hypothetical protein THAOC_23977 [Thalassiosira oceanica]|eukprot:EJK56187.1 hypothetical protein THAOC_23977 [Thalassiosira oceanica]
MTSDQVLYNPAFVGVENDLLEQCHQWGVKYQPPSDFEDKDGTRNRRRRIRRAIRERTDPLSCNAERERRRLARESKRCSDPAGHEASLVADSARKRSRYQSKSPSKRRRDDIDGESTTSPGRGEPMDIDGS